MPVTFPLPITTLFTGVKIVECTFTPSENLRTGRVSGGGRVANEYGTRYWHGRVRLRTLPHASQRDIEGLMDLIRSARTTFLATPIPNIQSGLQNGTLGNVTNGYTLTLNGVGANRALPRGTMLSFMWGTRYALHRTVEAVTANGSGVATVDVEPYVKPGWAASAAVNLTAPVCLAAYKPGSYAEPVYQAGVATGVEFEWEQIV